MALKGSSKWFSEKHEKTVAKAYEGKKSASSGGAVTDQGDIRVGRRRDGHLIECKHTGSYSKPAKSASLRLSDFEKVANEAWSESRTPMMSFSIYAPDSILACEDGCVYLSARLMGDDAPIVLSDMYYKEYPYG